MKKLTAIMLALALAISLCSVFAFAEEEAEAENFAKSITFVSADGKVTAVPRGATAPDVSSLIDGDFLTSASTHTTNGLVLFCNGVCTDASENPEFSLVVELERECTVTGLTIGLYEEFNAMIGTPKDGNVTVEYSEDGTDYVLVGDFNLGCVDGNEEYANGNLTPAVEICEVEFEAPVSASYVKVTFAYGVSPWQDGASDGKCVWEWITLSEVVVNASADSGVVVPDEPSDEPSDEPADGEKVNVLAGLHYTYEGTKRDTDGYSDFNEDDTCRYRLTDGTYADDDPGKGGTVAAYVDGTVSFVFDLGTTTSLAGFKAVGYSGQWGIGTPNSTEFLVSDDGENWTSVSLIATDDAVNTEINGWARHEYAVDVTASARYIKMVYDVTSHSWLAEVEAYAATEGGSDEPSYDFLSTATNVGINTPVTGESVRVFTNNDAIANGNITWSINVVLNKGEGDNYTVAGVYTSKAKYEEGCPEGLGENQILLAVHSSSSNMEEVDQYQNVAGKLAAMALVEGDVVVISGVEEGEITAVTYGIAAQPTPEDPSDTPTQPTSDNGIAALAVISVLAVAGAVIVKKSR